MKYKIAIASTDGVAVNQHYGKADHFYIVSADSESKIFEFIEKREVIPICKGRRHDDNALLESALKLKDCQYVLVDQIGYLAEIILIQEGLGVFELPGKIEESLNRLFTYIQLQHCYHHFVK